MKKEMHITGVFALLVFSAVSIFTSCSSAPKNTGDVYTLRAQAEAGLESGSREAGQGNFENALILLTESKRKAILADDPSLTVRVCLARGNVLFFLGRTEEAFAEWEQAVAEARGFGNGELLSLSRIYRARGMLILGRAEAQSVLDEVNRESANIKSERIYIAFSWQVKGLALRALGSYAEAENALRRSLEINEREKVLENASYDWYIIASIRSLQGNTTDAITALETSISIDRRIENSWGLAASWRAMGDVYRRAGMEQEAVEAYRRAITIYTAMGNEREVAETEKRMN
jgi:tetratricopeptide (TPR) repeat protein